MKLRTIHALPTGPLFRNPDVILAFGVAAIIGMMILPLPSALLDGLLALNMAFAALILVSSLLSEKPLSISTFPTLLLITTLYRLSLNISTTRMILSQGKAGEVIGAFGEFVLRGDVVVGMVIFLIITKVQFMVIGKGAERVAEVGPGRAFVLGPLMLLTRRRDDPVVDANRGLGIAGSERAHSQTHQRHVLL